MQNQRASKSGSRTPEGQDIQPGEAVLNRHTGASGQILRGKSAESYSPDETPLPRGGSSIEQDSVTTDSTLDMDADAGSLITSSSSGRLHLRDRGGFSAGLVPNITASFGSFKLAAEDRNMQQIIIQQLEGQVARLKDQTAKLRSEAALAKQREVEARSEKQLLFKYTCMGTDTKQKLMGLIESMASFAIAPNGLTDYKDHVRQIAQDIINTLRGSLPDSKEFAFQILDVLQAKDMDMDASWQAKKDFWSLQRVAQVFAEGRERETTLQFRTLDADGAQDVLFHVLAAMPEVAFQNLYLHICNGMRARLSLEHRSQISSLQADALLGDMVYDLAAITSVFFTAKPHAMSLMRVCRGTPALSKAQLKSAADALQLSTQRIAKLWKVWDDTYDDMQHLVSEKEQLEAKLNQLLLDYAEDESHVERDYMYPAMISAVIQMMENQEKLFRRSLVMDIQAYYGVLTPFECGRLYLEIVPECTSRQLIAANLDPVPRLGTILTQESFQRPVGY